MNSIPAGAFSRFMWRWESRYLLWLARVDVTFKHDVVAVAHYHYVLQVERHKGYTVFTINLFGKSWLVHIARRQFYVQRTDQETE